MAEGTVLQKNPISRLQEILQQWKYPLPVYREAQGNYQEFGTEVSLTLDDERYTFSGLARTKKTSKANAAQRALDFIAQHKPNLLEPPPLPVHFCMLCPPDLCEVKVQFYCHIHCCLLLLAGSG